MDHCHCGRTAVPAQQAKTGRGSMLSCTPGEREPTHLSLLLSLYLLLHLIDQKPPHRRSPACLQVLSPPGAAHACYVASQHPNPEQDNPRPPANPFPSHSPRAPCPDALASPSPTPTQLPNLKSIASGMPTMLLSPMTTTLFPLMSTPLRSKSWMHPSAVQGTKCAARPRIRMRLCAAGRRRSAHVGACRD